MMESKETKTNTLKQRLLQSKWMIVSFACLLVIVGLQSYFIFDLKSQVERVNESENANAVSITVNGQNAPNQWASPDPFQGNSLFDNFFGSNNWSPFEEMERMQDQMDELFGQAFGQFNSGSSFPGWNQSASDGLHIDVRDNKDKYVITVDISGADESSINVNLTEQELTISGTRVEAQEENNNSNMGSFFKREQRLEKFSRTITLDQPVKPEKMTTEHEDDTLIIMLPKEEWVSG